MRRIQSLVQLIQPWRRPAGDIRGIHIVLTCTHIRLPSWTRTSALFWQSFISIDSLALKRLSKTKPPSACGSFERAYMAPEIVKRSARHWGWSLLMEASRTLDSNTCKCGGCFDSLETCCVAVAISLREDTRVASQRWRRASFGFRGRLGREFRLFSQTFAKVVLFFFFLVLNMLVLFMPSNW